MEGGYSCLNLGTFTPGGTPNSKPIIGNVLICKVQEFENVEQNSCTLQIKTLPMIGLEFGVPPGVHLGAKFDP